MTEKELPYELPFTKLEDATLTNPYRFYIADMLGRKITDLQKEETIDFICLACNSYFEQKERIGELEDTLRFTAERLENIGKSHAEIDEILAKGDTNEQSD